MYIILAFQVDIKIYIYCNIISKLELNKRLPWYSFDIINNALPLSSRVCVDFPIELMASQV